MALAIGQESLYIENHENFVKSSTRNRAYISTAPGKQCLTIPIEGGRDHHQLYSKTKIALASNWQKRHIHSLQTAYASAPFFSHYIGKILPFYSGCSQNLFDFNLTFLKEILRLLKIDLPMKFTESYQSNPSGMIDFRQEEKYLSGNHFTRYYQVFEERNGFITNLCILDLLFHVGPQSKEYLYQLNQSWRQGITTY